jgi:hypothetical protein
MTTTTVPANAHTVVSTGWTNPSNAYASSGDNVYATILNGTTSKNISQSGDFGFADIASGTIPDNAIIQAARIVVEDNLSAAVTGGLFGLIGRISGVDAGTEVTQTTTTEATLTFNFATLPTIANLRAASTVIKARARGAKGNTSSALTVNLDFVRLEIDWVPPDPRPTVTTDPPVSTNVGTSFNMAFTVPEAVSAWRIRADSTTESDGTLLASGGSISAGASSGTISVPTTGLSAHSVHTIRVWVQLTSTSVWWRNFERRPFGVIMNDSATWTLANFQAVKANGIDVVMLQAYWDRLQGSNGATVTSDADWTVLTAAIDDAATAGLKVQLDISTHYPPSWALTAIPKFVNQGAQAWTVPTLFGRDIRDWVWESAGRVETDDFISQVVAGLASRYSKLHSIRVGGLTFGEALFPDARADGTFTSPSFWGFGTAAQGGAGLQTGMAAAPKPGYVPYVGGGGFSQSTANDNEWIAWYLDSMTRFIAAQIATIRAAGWTGRLYVMHPSFGIRDDWAITDASYKIELMMGADSSVVMTAYPDEPNTWPYATWMEDTDRGVLTVDSNKAAWRKVSEDAAANGGRHVRGMGENANTGNSAATLDTVVNGSGGALTAGSYLATMWLNWGDLNGGASGGFANYKAEITTRQDVGSDYATHGELRAVFLLPASGASGTSTASGGGVAVAAQTTNRIASQLGTGGGTAVVGRSSARAALQTATGGGVAVATRTSARAGAAILTGGGTAVAARVANRIGSATGTGGGVVVAARTSSRAATQTGTGAGVATVARTSARSAVQTGTGGGQAAYSYSTSSGVVSKSGTAVLTGGGVAVVTRTSARQNTGILTGGGVAVSVRIAGRLRTQVLTGGGAAVPAPTSSRTTTRVLTGGGVAVKQSLAARAITRVLTGGGVVIATVAPIRSTSLVLSASGVAVAHATSQRLVIDSVSGGGVAVYSWTRTAAALVGGRGPHVGAASQAVLSGSARGAGQRLRGSTTRDVARIAR